MKALLISCLAIALFAAGYLTARFESGRSSAAEIDTPAKLPREKTGSTASARHAPPQDFHLRFMDADYGEREKMMKDIDAGLLQNLVHSMMSTSSYEERIGHAIFAAMPAKQRLDTIRAALADE